MVSDVRIDIPNYCGQANGERGREEVGLVTGCLG